MVPERCRDVAHVSAVQLFTQVPEQTVDFFVRLLGLSEVARTGNHVYLRTWDDYERFTVCVTEATTSGIGRTWLRAAGPDDGVPAAVWYHVADKSYDLVYTSDWTGSTGRLHHVAFATDQREDILRAADVMLEAGIHIETGPHKHAIQQTFFFYVWEPGGNRIELCNAGARLVLAPDWRPISWSRAERAKGQAWGLKTIDTFHTHGTPPVDAAGPAGAHG